eukprot:PLAT3570.1.p1 GENE.PLAT3570.1~~PLAT3570.1.p1  ORF type:complete len:468 (+),score=260.68 PLAT3570.1:159-1562(+)
MVKDSGGGTTPGALLRVISQVYQDRASAMEVDEQCRKQLLADFTYEWFLNRFGLRSLAEKNFESFLENVKKLRRSSERVVLYSRFLENDDPFDVRTLNFYLRCCTALSPHFMRREAVGKGVIESLFLEESEEYINTPQITRYLSTMFVSSTEEPPSSYPLTPEASRFLLKRVKALEREVPRQLARKVVVDVDSVLAELMAAFLRQRQALKQVLKALFVAGDLDGDGVLSFDEFLQILEMVKPSISKWEAVRLFGEATQMSTADVPDVLDPDTFAAVAATAQFDTETVMAFVPAGLEPPKLIAQFSTFWREKRQVAEKFARDSEAQQKEAALAAEASEEKTSDEASGDGDDDDDDELPVLQKLQRMDALLQLAPEVGDDVHAKALWFLAAMIDKDVQEGLHAKSNAFLKATDVPPPLSIQAVINRVGQWKAARDKFGLFSKYDRPDGEDDDPSFVTLRIKSDPLASTV